MRLAIVGTAAAAAIGGTLAVAPLTLSTPERVAGGTCSAGQQCDRLAAPRARNPPARCPR